jgi:hypothetical protein
MSKNTSNKLILLMFIFVVILLGATNVFLYFSLEQTRKGYAVLDT